MHFKGDRNPKTRKRKRGPYKVKRSSQDKVKIEEVERPCRRSKRTPRLYSHFNVYKVVKRVIANDEAFRMNGGVVPLIKRFGELEDDDYSPSKKLLKKDAVFLKRKLQLEEAKSILARSSNMILDIKTIVEL